MLNYNHLYYFHVAALEGSVAAAAARLGVTQPTVSEQLRTLERTLGAQLFERHISGLKLTEAGRLAFEHTSLMFRAGERLIQALGHDETALPRTLRVGISSAVGRGTSTEFLMPLLALDNTVPSIQSGDNVELVRAVRANDLDLAIVESEPPAAARQGLQLVQLNRITLVAVVQPSAEPASDWANLGLVQYRASSALRWDVETFLDERGLRPNIAGEADDALFMLEAAARGGFVAFVPRSIARDAISTKRVKPITSIEATHAVFALYQDTDTAELARRAVELLIEHARAIDALATDRA